MENTQIGLLERQYLLRSNRRMRSYLSSGNLEEELLRLSPLGTIDQQTCQVNLDQGVESEGGHGREENVIITEGGEGGPIAGTGAGSANMRRQTDARRFNFTNISESKKWPWIIWLILKCLGTFWSRPVVENRCCQQCYHNELERADRFTNSESVIQMANPTRRQTAGIIQTDIHNRNHSYRVNVHQERSFNTFEPSRPADDIEGNEVDSVGVRDVIFSLGFYNSEGSFVDNDEFFQEVAENGRKGRCNGCDALWWNGDGRYCKYTDDSIGIRAWNNRGSGFISIMLLIFYLTLVLFDTGRYTWWYWGKEDYLIQYMSYLTYLIFGASVPCICFVCLVHNAFTQQAKRFSCWSRALDIRFIVRRLQYLNLAERGAPNKLFFTVCVGCPIGVALSRFMFYVLIRHSRKLNDYVASTTSLLLFTYYGTFSYIVYLLRISFESQLKLDVSFCRRNVNQLDVCRGKLASTIHDFKTLRELTNGWMIVVFAVMTFSLATQITWAYMLFSIGEHGTELSWTGHMYILCQIGMENAMFFFFPVFAMGGFNINHMWNRFLYRLTELRRERYDRFWYRLFHFIREENPVKSPILITVLFALIGFYLAMRVGDHSSYHHFRNSTEIM